jgi:hypothetical protein
MSCALAAIILLAASHAATAAELRAKDLIGSWALGVAHQKNAYYRFWPDQRYTGVDGDMILRGTWRLFNHGRKLALTLGGGVPIDQLTVPPTSEIIVIDRFDSRTLHVALTDGQKEIWKKLRRNIEPMGLTKRWSERRTAVRSTFEVTSKRLSRATLALVRRRSSCSR